MYTATIKIMGREYKSEGKTLFDALSSLEPTGVKKGASILQVQHNGRQRERVLTSVQTARLFSPSDLVRQVTLKSTQLLFDGL